MTQPRWRDQEATAAYRDAPDDYADFYRRPRVGDPNLDEEGWPRSAASHVRPRPRRWGMLPGTLGLCLVIGSAAVGALLTTLSDQEPGTVLGVFLVAGTIAGALAVRPRRGYLIIPAPALSYLVAGTIAGMIHDRANDTSHAALALNATQWIAAGFIPMAAATLIAIVIVVARWLANRKVDRGLAGL
jgi:hypothetical protein